MTPSSPYTIHSPGVMVSHPGSPNMPSKLNSIPDFFTLGPSAIEKLDARGDGMRQTLYDVGAPLSPFHYQLRKVSAPIRIRRA